ncbi:nucleolar and coiled-body phosphoprotein 1-like [Hordeum vulgare]|nr:nucleolar and coiled-body phosphoprotein 1-like [Hordeum vulgare]
MKQPAASPGRAEKPQLSAPLGLARLLLSKSWPATSPMFVSHGWSRAAAAAGADGESSSPKVTCIGQVRMHKGKKGRGYCRCLKKAFLCGGLFDFDRTTCRRKGPPPEAERAYRPWVFSSRDVAVAVWIRPLAA